MSKVKVSIVIVSYNSEAFIKECISSVLKNLPKDGEVIVLDNASTDRTINCLNLFSSKIKLIKSSENLGFSKGNNRAAKEALGEYLFFLNPDTVMEKPILEELIFFYKESEDVGIVGPKLVMPEGKVQPSAAKLPTIWGAIKELIFGIGNSYFPYTPEGNSPIEVECIFGAAMLIKAELFWQVGGFDEKYFLYYEDIDLCKRIKKAGKKVYYFPKVQLKHLVGATRSSISKYRLNYQSSIKYFGFIKALILQLIFKLHRFLNRQL